jgi:hypothetical protein
MKKDRFINRVASLFAICILVACCGARPQDAGMVNASATDPLNATYIIEGHNVRLINGRSETRPAPGSATRVITSIFGKPVYGNLDGRGGVDAALMLTYDPGGSGTFTYVAAALDENGMIRGTRAILLGDRVMPRKISIRNGVVIANYANRRPGEPMAAPPSVGTTKYGVLEGDALKEITPLREGEAILDGWVTIGHEVRSFRPCSQAGELWLVGNAPALNGVMAAYRETLHDQLPYRPLFMTLAGKTAEPVPDGFGAGYEGSFVASRLVRVFPQGNCKSDLIYVESPLPGAPVASPLKIRGHARGQWFFEGDFPVVLRNADGKSIAKGYATAKNGWMTELFVPFESVIEFNTPPSASNGTLVLKKDNPTDRPEFDDALEIPVLFFNTESLQ